VSGKLLYRGVEVHLIKEYWVSRVRPSTCFISEARGRNTMKLNIKNYTPFFSWTNFITARMHQICNQWHLWISKTSSTILSLRAPTWNNYSVHKAYISL